MDLNLSEGQDLFRETTRKFLEAKAPVRRSLELAEDPEGFDRTALMRGAELGWFCPLVPEENGGGSVSGSGIADLAIVAEELGRVLFPGPVLDTNLVAWAVAAAGSEAQRREHLDPMALGQRLASWAFWEAADGWDRRDIALVASVSGERVRLSGSKGLVPYAGSVDLLLVTGSTDRGLTQVLVPTDAPGVTIEPLETLDLTRRLARVTFHQVELPMSAVVGQPGGAAQLVEDQLRLAAALQCAETVGALERAFEFTLEYAKLRKAFGRPIGSFQALKHRFSDMVWWLESAKAASVAAIQAVQDNAGAAEAVSVAKSYIGEKGPQIVRDCLQIHGGIGCTWEHEIHLYLRRVDANAILYGGTDAHRDRLAVMVGLGEGTGA